MVIPTFLHYKIYCLTSRSIHIGKNISVLLHTHTSLAMGYQSKKHKLRYPLLSSRYAASLLQNKNETRRLQDFLAREQRAVLSGCEQIRSHQAAVYSR